MAHEHEPVGPGISHKVGDVWVGPAVCKICGDVFAAYWESKEGVSLGKYLGEFKGIPEDEEPPPEPIECPECGPVTRCDEDGCCLMCGTDLLHDEDGHLRT